MSYPFLFSILDCFSSLKNLSGDEGLDLEAGLETGLEAGLDIGPEAALPKIFPKIRAGPEVEPLRLRTDRMVFNDLLGSRSS